MRLGLFNMILRKKIWLVFICTTCFTVTSTSQYWSKMSYNPQFPALRAEMEFYPPLRDTSWRPFRPGALTISTMDGLPYLWTGAKWQSFFGNFASLSANNIWTGINTFFPVATSSGSGASSMKITPTFQAGANAERLIALDIQSTIISNGFGNLRNIGIRHSGDIIPVGANQVIGAAGASTYGSIFVNNLSSGSTSQELTILQGSVIRAKYMGSTGNLVLQNAGIFIDNGAKLQVSGGITNTGTITTGSPAGGTSASFKIGSIITGLTVTVQTNKFLQIEINGVAYKLALVE